MTASRPEIEALAAAIGDEVYIDVAKWHLFLNDAKLHMGLAERLWPMVESGRIDEDAVADLLKETPVPVGGGRTTLDLHTLLPMQGIMALIDVLETAAEDY